MSVDLERPVTEDGALAQRRPRRWSTILTCLIAGAAVGVLGTVGVIAATDTGPAKLSGAAAEIPLLAQPQQSADKIPKGISGYDYSLIDSGSSRLAGQTSGISYYLSQSTSGQVCLLILPSDPSQRWAQSCADGLPFAVASAGAGSAKVVSSGTDAPVGMTRLGLNVLVDPTSTSLNN